MAYVDIIIILIIINFMLQRLAEQTDKILFHTELRNPVITQGEIVEFGKASLLEERMAHYSGFYFSVVEYDYSGIKCKKNVMRFKGDYIGRKIELAVEQGYVVRIEQEKLYAFPAHILMCFLIPYFVIYNVVMFNKDFVLTGLVAVLVVMMIYANRKPIVRHIYKHREIEWRNKWSVKFEPINEDKLSKIVAWIFIAFLILFVFLMLYFTI